MRNLASCALSVMVALALLFGPSCQPAGDDDDDTTPDDMGDDDTAGDDDDSAPPPPPTYLEQEPLVIAVGDVHGDLAATREVLMAVGAIDEGDHWIGGEMVLVQTGDQIDRGDDDRAVLDMFAQLAEEAAAAGGMVLSVLGNHETENVDLNFDYVTPASLAAFDDIEVDPGDTEVLELDETEHHRGAAFRAGGPYAQLLASRNMIQVVGPVVFVHGSLTPSHMEQTPESLNAQTQAWMRGEADRPMILWGSFNPVWSRRYCDAPDEGDCEALGEVLAAVPAEVMVLGHTVHEAGVTSYCDERAWCIDTGMSDYYGGNPAALEIVDGGQITVIE